MSESDPLLPLSPSPEINVTVPTNELNATEADQFPHLLTLSHEQIYIRTQELRSLAIKRELTISELRELVACFHILQRANAGPPKSKTKAATVQTGPSLVDQIEL